MLEISYNKTERLIKIISENANAFSEIRRICEEICEKDEYRVISSQAMVLYWWRYLELKSELAYLVRKYNLKIKLDQATEELMKKSRQKQVSYKEINEKNNLSYQEVESILKRKGFTRTLKDFQLRNVSKIATMSSAASFSVPGAGKTTEALAFYTIKKTTNSRLLIIAPKNAFPAWDEQIKECIKNPPVIERLVGGRENIKKILKEKPEILMINYNQLPKVQDLIAEYMDKYEFFMFIDESHRMKRGYSGVYGKAILSLSNLPEYKLILSGTPMPKDEEDLVPQFNFLYPEIKVNKDNVDRLIQPIYVRTTKDDLQLKKAVIKKTIIEMNPNHRRFYELLVSEASRQAEEYLKTSDKLKLREMGRCVIRLIQATSNPALLSESDLKEHQILKDVFVEGDSAKLAYVCKRARELALEGKKVLIWSSFVQNVELLTSRLADLGADYIHGGVDVGSEEDKSTREGKIKRFHEDPNAFILVANPAAASEGISLHKVCHYAIYMDRNYNAAQYLQSMDRIHRVGLPKDIETIIEIVECKDSIDESVEERLNDKIGKMSEILNDTSLKPEYQYSDEELEDDMNEGDITSAIENILGKELN